MSGIDDILEAGKGILQDVTAAVESKNYNNLKSSISYRVLTAGDKIRREAVMASKQNAQSRRNDFDPGPSMATERAQAAQQYKETKVQGQPYVWQNGAAWRKAQSGEAPPSASHHNAGQSSVRTAPPVAPQKSRKPLSNFLYNPVNPSTGTLFIVLGAIGFGICTPSAIGLLLRSMSIEPFGLKALFVFATVIFSVLSLGSLFLLFSGIRSKKMVERFYQYGDMVGDAEYVDLKSLAGRLGVSTRKVLNDLKNMIRRGFLPKARLDKDESTLMLTDKVYDQYMETERNRQEMEEKKRQEEEAAREAYKNFSPEVAKILTDGEAYMKHVREVNDLIPDTEEMSNRLYRLEEIMHKIFDQVKKKPEQAGNLRRFMDYYLPTIEKLLNGYLELEDQADSSQNVAQARKEIEGAIDMVNDAFENLLESFFQDQVWDLSSDISVMKTMLTQDGLVEQK